LFHSLLKKILPLFYQISLEQCKSNTRFKKGNKAIDEKPVEWWTRNNQAHRPVACVDWYNWWVVLHK